MNNRLEKLFKDRLLVGLKRQAIQNCSQWSTMYRVMGPPFPGMFGFRYHPWTKEIHDAKENLIVGMKAAQMGYTEIALNKTFYTIDILSSSVLYFLPTSTPDATNFSAARFDPALELSPHLRNMFSDVKNVGHKRAGNASLFIRGARSRSQAKSVPASLVIFDELDEMNREVVVLARERISGQNIGQEFMLSTPTIGGHGIDVYWQDSTQEYFFFKCPSCGRFERLVYPDSLIITAEDYNDPKINESHLICTQCKAILPNGSKPDWLAEENCQWVPSFADRQSRGFAVSQLYSMAEKSSPVILAIKALKARKDPTEEQELYNSNLGECHTVKGARVDDEDIKDATKGYKSVERVDRLGWYMMGVDVGPKYLYIEITEYLRTSNKKITYDLANSTLANVLKQLTVEQFEELDPLMRQYNIMHTVIDAQPETRKALEFAQRFLGMVSLCYYSEGSKSKDINRHTDKVTISAGRTVWLDTSLMRFKRGTIHLPCDIDLEYREHIKALTRVFDKDTQGNPVGRYVCGNQPDHFAHARNYNEMALELALSSAGNQNIQEQPT